MIILETIKEKECVDMGLFEPVWTSKNPKKIIAAIEKKFYPKKFPLRRIPLDVANTIASSLSDDSVCTMLFSKLTDHVMGYQPKYSLDDCIELVEKCPAEYWQLAYAAILRTLLRKTFPPAGEHFEYTHYTKILKVYEKVTDEKVKAEAQESYWMTHPPSKFEHEFNKKRQEEMDANRRNQANKSKEQKEKDAQAYVESKQKLDREYYESGGN